MVVGGVGQHYDCGCVRRNFVRWGQVWYTRGAADSAAALVLIYSFRTVPHERRNKGGKKTDFGFTGGCTRRADRKGENIRKRQLVGSRWPGWG